MFSASASLLLVSSVRSCRSAVNPGDLVAPVTLEHLRERRRSHASRNPLIVRVLVEAGIMREEGEGIPRMFEEMEEAHLKPPELSVGNMEFQVTLRNTPVFSQPQQESVWVESRAASLRQHFKTHQTLTNTQYREQHDLTRYVAARKLRRLVGASLLQPAGEGRGAHYTPGPALALEERKCAKCAHISRTLMEKIRGRHR